MSCASVEELLLDYADLPAQERDAVDLHLTRCASCRQYSDTLPLFQGLLIYPG
jgi:predicted anti-sigma-YlaC factor YlaD